MSFDFANAATVYQPTVEEKAEEAKDFDLAETDENTPSSKGSNVPSHPPSNNTHTIQFFPSSFLSLSVNFHHVLAEGPCVHACFNCGPHLQNASFNVVTDGDLHLFDVVKDGDLPHIIEEENCLEISTQKESDDMYPSTPIFILRDTMEFCILVTSFV
jgi:hypothetical protein